MTNIKFAFFGSSRFSVIVLGELERLGLIPCLIITTPDKPKGRKLTITATEVKKWGLKRKITVLDPQKLDADFFVRLSAEVQAKGIETFIVASYGKIIPEKIIDLPVHKTLNIHPSLLPKYRGPSPMPSAILNDEKKSGVTIIRLDKEMDHGPIIAQEIVEVAEWPTYEEYEELMAKKGAQLLAKILPEWIDGKMKEVPQIHEQATFTKKISKENGLTDLSSDPYLNFRKIQAYHEWPQAYFLFDHKGKNIRVKITSASFKEGVLIIENVIPEGSKEMSFEDFQKGYGTIESFR